MNQYICELEARTACGTTRFYPLNDKAKQFVQLLKLETLTKLHIKRIRDLGYTVNIYHIANGNPMLCADQVSE